MKLNGKQTLPTSTLAKMKGKDAVRERYAMATSPQPKSKPKNV